jgi:gliding motility-associated-like protein
MKKIIYLLIAIGCKAYSQSLSPQVINSAGGSGTVGTGTTAVQVYYNIGEPVINTIGNGTNSLTQGFLQPDVLGKFGLNISPLFSNESCLSKNDGKINLILNTQPQNAVTIKYIWTPHFICPYDNCSSVDSLAPGNYSVFIEALGSSSNILDTVTKQFTITANTDPCQIITYTGFSPNGDGLNDTWIIGNIENFPNNSVHIYNRWGSQIIGINNYNNTYNAWNGQSSSGSVLPNGTYFYVIELNNGAGVKKGWVELTGK